jgi:hypothetical protein
MLRRKLRRYLIPLLLALGSGSPAFAGSLTQILDDIKTNSNLKLFDNLQPATFYNLKKGTPRDQRVLGGGVTTFYQYRLLDVQIGTVKMVDTGDNYVPVFGAGLRLEKYIAKGIGWVAPYLGESANTVNFKNFRTGPYVAYQLTEPNKYKRIKAYGYYISYLFGNPN